MSFTVNFICWLAAHNRELGRPSPQPKRRERLVSLSVPSTKRRISPELKCLTLIRHRNYKQEPHYRWIALSGGLYFDTPNGARRDCGCLCTDDTCAAVGGSEAVSCLCTVGLLVHMFCYCCSAQIICTRTSKYVFTDWSYFSKRRCQHKCCCVSLPGMVGSRRRPGQILLHGLLRGDIGSQAHVQRCHHGHEIVRAGFEVS